MSYIESGVNRFLERPFRDSYVTSELSPDDAATYFRELPASQLAGGKTRSFDGKLSIDWDTGALVVTNGAQERVLIGYIAEEDDYGIKIYDTDGTEIFSITGELQTDGIADSAVTNAKIASIAAEKILAGDITVAVDVGDITTGFTRLDGVNNRIIINDGTDNRIVIGDV